MTQALRTALVPVAAAALSTAVLSQTLTELPSGYGGSVSMSSDATWVVGNDNNTGGSFIWSAASGPISFGDNNTFAKAVSDDGDKVLCSVHHPISGLRESAIYNVAAGTFTYMDTWVGGSSCGSLTSPYDMTPDGRKIAGSFTDPVTGFAGDGWLLEPPNPLTDLGGSSAGTGGLHPVLSAEGSFFPGAPFDLYLDDAAGSAVSVLLVSTQNIQVPLFGGILQTFPLDFTQALLTSPTGEWDIGSSWPPAMVGGVSLYFQVAAFDPSAVGQFALSNGLGATTP